MRIDCGKRHEIHVSASAPSTGDGTPSAPFSTIQAAADIAQPGDHIIVHAGTYRENVDPKHGGRDDYSRIVYEAAEGEPRPVIKGSEILNGWESVGDGVWTAMAPNALFDDFNPYTTKLEGDWLEQPSDWKLNLGAVYLNGKSLYQAQSCEDVKAAKRREIGPGPDWVKIPLPLSHPEDSIYQWYSEAADDGVRFWANFHDIDPNDELVEINVREECFYPRKTGRNYITLKGFEMAHAACPWAPPTADQPGMVGPHWSKGWIIEDNLLHDATCSAISLGKEYSTGENESYFEGRKPGYQCQLETVFRARHNGWDKETIGSHIVRNNVIHDCGQNGIVGHMGCAFSRIEGNTIYNIGTKYEYFGHEIAGIKLHAAIDTQIVHNNIHDCILGTWLDWQAQGTRVSSNVYHHNVRDVMIEVTHGPCLFDNNVFASAYNFDNAAQGTAFVHNLFCGSTRKITVPDRFTPYHLPHSTKVLGTACVYGNDDRIVQNIFAGATVLPGTDTRGTDIYNGAPASEEEYLDRVHGQGTGDVEIFEGVPQPAYISGNMYFLDAPAYESEQGGCGSSADLDATVTEDGEGAVWLDTTLPEAMGASSQIIDTASLGAPRLTCEHYESPEGKAIRIDHDLTGAKRDERPTPGPLESLHAGQNHVRIF